MSWARDMLELSRHLKHCFGRFVMSVFCGLFSKVLGLLTALLGAYVTVQAFAGRAEGMRGLLLLLFAGIVLQGFFSYMDMVELHYIAYRILEILREKIYFSLYRSAPSGTRKNRSGGLGSVIMEDIEVLENFYAHTVGFLIYTLLYLLMVLIPLIRIRPEIAGIVLAASIAIVWVPWALRKWGERIGRSIREKSADLHADLIDSVQGLREILLFHQEERVMEKIGEATKKLNFLEKEDGHRKGMQMGLLNLLMSLALIAVILICHFSVAAGELNPLLAPLMIILAANVFEPISGVAGAMMNFPKIRASAARVRHLLQLPPNVLYPERDEEKELEPSVEFRKVRFSYEREGELLKEVSFRCGKGEKLALTGASGEGKSTIAQLLMRFYDAGEGEIFIGNEPLKKLTHEHICRMISYLPQDIYLFNQSILENIRIVRPSASDEEVIEAAKAAVADDFIRRLPQGYQTKVGERGTKLSGGEKQRISIARAILRQAPILIFDEAVSSLDSENELRLMEVLSGMKEKTMLIIAHRESTLRLADRRVELKEGRIVGNR